MAMSGTHDLGLSMCQRIKSVAPPFGTFFDLESKRVSFSRRNAFLQFRIIMYFEFVFLSTNKQNDVYSSMPYNIEIRQSVQQSKHD